MRAIKGNKAAAIEIVRYFDYGSRHTFSAIHIPFIRIVSRDPYRAADSDLVDVRCCERSKIKHGKIDVINVDVACRGQGAVSHIICEQR